MNDLINNMYTLFIGFVNTAYGFGNNKILLAVCIYLDIVGFTCVYRWILDELVSGFNWFTPFYRIAISFWCDIWWLFTISLVLRIPVIGNYVMGNSYAVVRTVTLIYIVYWIAYILMYRLKPLPLWSALAMMFIILPASLLVMTFMITKSLMTEPADKKTNFFADTFTPAAMKERYRNVLMSGDKKAIREAKKQYRQATKNN